MKTVKKNHKKIYAYLVANKFSKSSEKINFFYRGSDLPEDLIFLSATFRGDHQDSKKIKKKIEKCSITKNLSPRLDESSIKLPSNIFSSICLCIFFSFL